MFFQRRTGVRHSVPLPNASQLPLRAQLAATVETVSDSDSVEYISETDSECQSSASEFEEKSDDSMDVDTEEIDEECNSDLLQRLYRELRKFTALDDVDNRTRPWPNGWYALLDIMRLVHGCSLEMLDMWIQMLHWLVDNEDPLTHEALPKNARHLERWNKKNFPDFGQFIGLWVVAGCQSEYDCKMPQRLSRCLTRIQSNQPNACFMSVR